jgi:hypothetical protein
MSDAGSGVEVTVAVLVVSLGAAEAGALGVGPGGADDQPGEEEPGADGDDLGVAAPDPGAAPDIDP